MKMEQIEEQIQKLLDAYKFEKTNSFYIEGDDKSYGLLCTMQILAADLINPKPTLWLNSKTIAADL